MSHENSYPGDRLDGTYPTFRVELPSDVQKFIEAVVASQDDVMLKVARRTGDLHVEELDQAEADIMSVLTGRLSLDGDLAAFASAYKEIFSDRTQMDMASSLVHKDQSGKFMNSLYQIADEQITPDLARVVGGKDLYDLTKFILALGHGTREEQIEKLAYSVAMYLRHSEKAQGEDSILRRVRDTLANGSFDRHIMQDMLGDGAAEFPATYQAIGLIQGVEPSMDEQEALHKLADLLTGPSAELLADAKGEIAKVRDIILQSYDETMAEMALRYDKHLDGRSDRYEEVLAEAVERYREAQIALERSTRRRTTKAKKRGNKAVKIATSVGARDIAEEAPKQIEPRPVGEYLLAKSGEDSTTTLGKAVAGFSNSKDLHGAIEYIATYFGHKIDGRPMDNGIKQFTDVKIGKNGSSRPVFGLNPNSAAWLGKYANKSNLREYRIIFTFDPDDTEGNPGAVRVIAIAKREKGQVEVIQQIRRAQVSSH